MVRGTVLTVRHMLGAAHKLAALGTKRCLSSASLFPTHLADEIYHICKH